MRILTVVKKTGYNFIRHYWSAFPPGSDVVHRADEALKLIPQFDIVLFEWANDLTAQIINSEKFRELQSNHEFKTVVRVHDHEVTKVYADARRIDFIQWGRVDRIWFINPAVQELFIQLKGNRNKTFFLPNAVDSIYFTEKQTTEKKAGILSIYYRPRKSLWRVVEMAKALPDWSFYIRAHIPQPYEQFHEEYFKIKQLAEGVPNVIFEHRDVNNMIRGGYDYKDLPDWYADKAVILSTSIHEGFHYAVGEGMLSGCKPIVFNWPTAGEFWGKYVVNSIEHATNEIRNYRPSSSYRHYVWKRFDPVLLTKKLMQLI